MMQRRSSLALCSSLLASMLMVSACSTVQQATQTGNVSGDLLAHPPTLPQFPRSADGTINGAMCVSGALDLYDVAGLIRAQAIGLIDAENARRNAPAKEPPK